MHSANSKAFDVSGKGIVNNEKLADPLITQAYPTMYITFRLF
jgi:hypothetical protein